MITKNKSNMLERCLKTGLHIIYQERYLSFNNALKLANMRSLKKRRLEAITNFSKKALVSNKYRNWFSKNNCVENRTRWKPTAALKPVPCRTQRYKKSSLPLITKLLTWHPPLTYTALDLAWISLLLLCTTQHIVICLGWLLCQGLCDIACYFSVT